MKILHLSTYDLNGGAARGAFRIFQAQKMAGLEVEMYCLVKQSNDPDIHAIDLKKVTNKNFLPDFLRFQRNYAGNPDGILKSDGLISPGIIELINNSDADIVQLHWINYLLSIEDIQKITKPLTWYFHDQWPLGGELHYYPDTIRDFRWNNGVFFDGDDDVFEKKKEAFPGKFSHLFVPGAYIEDFANESSLFASTPVSQAPYPWVNPVPGSGKKIDLKYTLGLSDTKRNILFVNHQGPDNGSKGSAILKQIVRNCPEDWFFIVIGDVFQGQPMDNCMQLNSMDYEKLSAWFSAADVLLMPSRHESFSLVSQEAQMHGLPVVSYRHNGTSAIVSHMETGYLVSQYTADVFMEGLKSVFNAGLTGKTEEIQARTLEKFLPARIGEAFKEIYTSVLK